MPLLQATAATKTGGDWYAADCTTHWPQGVLSATGSEPSPAVPMFHQFVRNRVVW